MIAATLKILNLNAIDDPCDAGSKADAPKALRKQYLEKLACQIVTDYVLNTAQNVELANRIVEEDS